MPFRTSQIIKVRFSNHFVCVMVFWGIWGFPGGQRHHICSGPRISLQVLQLCKLSGLQLHATTMTARILFFFSGCRKWGCNKWGFKGCLAALPGNRPKSAKIALFLPFSPFSGGCEEHLENPENGGKRPFPQICLNPHLLNPHLRHSKLFFLRLEIGPLAKLHRKP